MKRPKHETLNIDRQRGDIKWREEDVTELNRLIRNHNSKLKRITKTGDIYNFPNNGFTKTLRLDDVSNIIHTRADYNYFKNVLNAFNAKGSTDLIKTKGKHYMPKFEETYIRESYKYQNYNKRVSAKKQMNEPYKEGPQVFEGTQKVKPTFDTKPVTKTFHANTATESKIKLKKKVSEQVLMNLLTDNQGYRDNWIKAINTTFSDTQASELIGLLNKISMYKLLNDKRSNQAYSDIDFFYEDGGQFDRLKDYFHSLLGE